VLSADQLTNEQRAIAAHANGPALVFAVAGAGKTTSLVHRIRTLVTERGVDPERILASSFGRATVGDLEQALAAIDLDRVDTRTLHSLGLRLLRRAETKGLRPPRLRQQDTGPATIASRLAHQSLTQLAMKRDLDTAELGIDASDLLDQIGAWKQALAYADLDAADLPASARADATEAEHENEDVLTLYRIYETLRREQNALTYDDMLVEGWEVLHRFPEIREDAQSAYDHVLVDEFQDVSRVQDRMLDLLTEPRSPDAPRNYMVVGDDDQCIYEWRGADPSFLLDFADRYDADEYLITDTFRSPAPQVALANAVIQANDQRREKTLHLTRGFDGHVEIVGRAGPQAEATGIADPIQRLRDQGWSLDDMVVLVRTYAQTPPLEQVLIDRDIPYRIVGNVPFYRRREVQTLLQYAYWAVLERKQRRNGWFDSHREVQRYVDRFARIVKRPSRYVKHNLVDTVCSEAVETQTSALDVLEAHRSAMHDRTAERVDAFCSAVRHLIDRLDDPAGEVLAALLDDINYEDYLREHSAVPERGEARVRTVQSLLDVAEGAGSLPALLQDIVRLSRRHSDEGTGPSAESSRLDLRSIHRAKGLEWPVVFVPNCNNGTIPQANSTGDASAASPPIEEERRLFYVALTRSRHRLVLTYDTTDETSPFLVESEAENVLQTVAHVRTGLRTPPGDLSDTAVARLCRGVSQLAVKRYLRTRLSLSPEHREALISRLRTLEPVLQEARDTVASSDPNPPPDSAPSTTDRLRSVMALQEAVGEQGIPLTNEQPDTFYPEAATFAFTWADDELVATYQGERVGTVDPFSSTGPPPEVVLDAPWEAVVARFERVGRGRRTLYVSIDQEATRRRLTSSEAANHRGSTATPSPDETTHLLASEAVQDGARLLLDVLAKE